MGLNIPLLNSWGPEMLGPLNDILRQIDARQVSSLENIQDLGIRTGALEDGLIDASKLANNSVFSRHIVNGTIIAEDLSTALLAALNQEIIIPIYSIDARKVNGLSDWGDDGDITFAATSAWVDWIGTSHSDDMDNSGSTSAQVSDVFYDFSNVLAGTNIYLEVFGSMRANETQYRLFNVDDSTTVASITGGATPPLATDRRWRRGAAGTIPQVAGTQRLRLQYRWGSSGSGNMEIQAARFILTPNTKPANALD